MKRTLAAAASLGIVAALSVAGCTTDGGGAQATSTASPSVTTTYDPALASFYTQKIAWAPCDDAECAKLTVPVDYAKPTGPTTQLALLRVKSPSRNRQGSLVVNPGGPGGSGVDYARYAGNVFSGQITRAFDVVGFDPRGVGQSAPIECLDGPDFDRFLSLDPTPDTPAEEQAIVTADRAFGAACEKRNAQLLPHVSTEDVARDMDVLRAALGDNQLHYFGASYGTFLGATYADLFPKNVGRMVLDGAMDPKLTGEELGAGQAGGFETAFNAYVTACVADGGCPLGDTEDAAKQTVRSFLKGLDAKPIDARGDGPAGGLDEAWASYGIAAALYDKGQWDILTSALEAALQGNGGPLMQLGMTYAERDQDGHYNGNMLQVINAVNCLDRGASADSAHYQELSKQYAAKWPTFGPFMAWSGMMCGTWPVKATGRAHAITAPGAAPIVVVGTTRDPATPYEEAVSLANQLSSGRLITRDGDGHTGYGKGNSCVDKAVNSYLAKGVDPGKDTRC